MTYDQLGRLERIRPNQNDALGRDATTTYTYAAATGLGEGQRATLSIDTVGDDNQQSHASLALDGFGRVVEEGRQLPEG